MSNKKEYLVTVETTDDKEPTATKIMLNDQEVWSKEQVVDATKIYNEHDEVESTTNPMHNNKNTENQQQNGGSKTRTLKSSGGKYKKKQTTKDKKKKTRKLRKKNKL